DGSLATRRYRNKVRPSAFSLDKQDAVNATSRDAGGDHHERFFVLLRRLMPVRSASLDGEPRALAGGFRRGEGNDSAGDHQQAIKRTGREPHAHGCAIVSHGTTENARVY